MQSPVTRRCHIARRMEGVERSSWSCLDYKLFTDASFSLSQEPFLFCGSAVSFVKCLKKTSPDSEHRASASVHRLTLFPPSQTFDLTIHYIHRHPSRPFLLHASSHRLGSLYPELLPSHIADCKLSIRLSPRTVRPGASQHSAD